MVDSSTKSITGIIAMLIVGLLFSPLLVSLVSGSQTYDYTTYQLSNPTFTDNASPWENVAVGAVNVWSAGAVGTGTTDNAGIDNGWWFQPLDVTSLSDGVASATISFGYAVVDNDNASTITMEVYLENATDNILIWQSASTAKSTLTTQENDVTSLITTTGNYTLFLRANLKPLTTVPLSSVIVGWDDANLTVVTRTNTNASLMVFAYMIPLFFIIGIVLSVIYWATRRE